MWVVPAWPRPERRDRVRGNHGTDRSVPRASEVAAGTKMPTARGCAPVPSVLTALGFTPGSTRSTSGPRRSRAASSPGSRRRCCGRPRSCSRSSRRWSTPASSGSTARDRGRDAGRGAADHGRRPGGARRADPTGSTGSPRDRAARRRGAHVGAGRADDRTTGRRRGGDRRRPFGAGRGRPGPAQQRRPAVAAPRPVARPARGPDDRAGRRGASRRAAGPGRSTRCARSRGARCSPPGSRSARRSGCSRSCRPGCWSSATRTRCCPEPLGLADSPLVVIRQRGVVEADRAGSSCCGSAPPCPASSGAGAAPDLRRFLLEQLAAGAHDEQIARKLGISLRTVRRRVAA